MYSTLFRSVFQNILMAVLCVADGRDKTRLVIRAHMVSGQSFLMEVECWGHCVVVVVVLLGDKCDGHGVSDVDGRSVCDAGVSFAE